MQTYLKPKHEKNFFDASFSPNVDDTDLLGRRREDSSKVSSQTFSTEVLSLLKKQENCFSLKQRDFNPDILFCLHFEVLNY